MALTDVAVRTAKPREKSYNLSDSDGLYLEVIPTADSTTASGGAGSIA